MIDYPTIPAPPGARCAHCHPAGARCPYLPEPGSRLCEFHGRPERVRAMREAIERGRARRERPPSRPEHGVRVAGAAAQWWLRKPPNP